MYTMKVNVRYLPRRLTRKDRQTQWKALQKSRKGYSRGMYYVRKPVKSFTSKRSGFLSKAEKLYKVKPIGATRELAKATQCSRSSLAQIIRKGKGAYFSSGSRPNQTPESWGIARLASAITGGKAAAVDYAILEEGCHPRSKALLLAKRARSRKLRKAPKVNV